MKKMFMISLLLTFITQTIVAESITVEKYYHSCNSAEQSKFILTCIKNANPKSDEEPEDWLYQCKNISLDLYCSSNYRFFYYRHVLFGDNINCNCEQCIDTAARKKCGKRGFEYD